MRLGVLDIGSNTRHLLVVDAHEDIFDLREGIILERLDKLSVLG